MGLKKLSGKLHLWLGLASGFIVLISILPAAVFVWDEELTDWYYADYVTVQAQGKPLPVSKLYESARQAAPEGRPVKWALIRNDPAKAYLFETYQKSESPGWTFFSEIDYWDKIYVNPYTGEVSGTVNAVYDWIYLCRVMHQQLLLRYDIGHWPVAVATLILFAMVVSGLVLWWPKNKKALRQRLRLQWKKTDRWRRKNYGLHNVGGFYAFLFILLLGVTGLVWSFDWWTNGIYRLMGDDPELVFKNFRETAALHPDTATLAHPLDKAFADMQRRRSTWTYAYITLPETFRDSTEDISVFLSFSGLSAWDDSDQYEYRAHSGEAYRALRQENKSLGEKWRNSNYAIHVGSIWGWPTKVLATAISLVCSSLPLTGFLIWWGRRNKRRRGRPARAYQRDRKAVASSSKAKARKV